MATSIGERLKEERERLGLTQVQFADLVGAGKRTVIYWEQGSSAPDLTQAASLVAVGFDIQYVIMGIRTIASASESLPPDSKVEIVNEEEAELLEGYRELTEENRRLLRRAVSPPTCDATHQVTRKRANSK